MSKSNDKCSYKRHIEEESHMEKRRPCEETEVRVTEPQAKNCPQRPEATEAEVDSALEPPEEHFPADTLVWDSGLQNSDNEFLLC